RSTTPAEYAIIDIYLDSFFERLFIDNILRPQGKMTRDGREFDVFRRQWSAPSQLPIFAEITLPVTEFINLAIPKDLVAIGFDFRLGYAVRAPGCSVEEFVRVILQGQTLWIPE